jgi:peptidylprolyl isomerase
MAKPQQGNTVKIHYTGRFLDGTEFDSSRGREPLAFEIGGGLVIPGFEKAVLDLEPGQSTNITIPPAEAYGEMREEMIAVVPSAQFPENITPEGGVMFQIALPDGKTLTAEITDIEGDNVTVNANHRLAGKDLVFDIELVEIA